MNPTPYTKHPEHTPGQNRTCKLCGCTDEQACEGGCYWITDALCSKCFTDPARLALPSSALAPPQSDPIPNPNPQDRNPNAVPAIAAEFRNLQKPLDTIATALCDMAKTHEDIITILMQTLATIELATGIRAVIKESPNHSPIVLPFAEDTAPDEAHP
jgi:hypothetical protein